MKQLTLTFCALLMVAPGCSDDKETPPDGEPKTFWQDVAPIYFDNCVSCHQDGGIAPFALDNYDDAKTFAAASRLAVENRVMPPWLVTDDDSCGSFQDSRWMTDEDIATIASWVDEGTPEGTVRDDLRTPDLPSLSDGVAYSTPQFTPEIVGGTLAEFDEYRCFLIDPALDSAKFITGYEVIPGNNALVHHALVIPVDPDQVVDPVAGTTNMDVMQALDDASPDRDGWPCFGLAGEGVEALGVPVTWAPGMGVVDYPEGTGMQVPPDTLLVVQMHYNMAEEEVRGQSDSTAIMLRYEDSVPRQGFFTLPDGLLDTLFDGDPVGLEPGKDSVTFTWEEDFDEELAFIGVPHVDLYGVFPHMHERGRKLNVEVVRADSSAECGADVQSWDFGWQLFYFYDQPIRFNPGDKIRVTCEFDTSGLTEPVMPGWGTQNEMCLAGLYLVVP